MTVLMMNCLLLEWLNEPYFFCMNKYWPEARNVLSSENPFKDIPHIRPPQSNNPDGIANTSWVDAFHWSLNEIDDEFILYMHPDYLLYDRPDLKALKYAKNYMEAFPDVLRINVGANYGYADKGVVVEEFDNMQIRECENRNCFHPVSLTPGLWRKSVLMELCDCEQGYTSWNLESLGMEKFLTTHTHLRSLAMNPEPIKFSNAIYGRQNERLKLHSNIAEEIRAMLPKGKTIEIHDK